MNNERISIIEKAIEVMEEGLEKYQNELNEVNEEIGLFEEDYCPYLEQDKIYYPLRDKDPYTIDLETSLQVIKDTEEWRKNNPPKDRPKGVWKRTFKKK